jgi:hypothetical protein
MRAGACVRAGHASIISSITAACSPPLAHAAADRALLCGSASASASTGGARGGGGGGGAGVHEPPDG